MWVGREYETSLYIQAEGLPCILPLLVSIENFYILYLQDARQKQTSIKAWGFV